MRKTAVAKQFGISTTRISDIERRALYKLKKKLRGLCLRGGDEDISFHLARRGLIWVIAQLRASRMKESTYRKHRLAAERRQAASRHRTAAARHCADSRHNPL